ncbi:MAG: inorganic phosphate transporter, partial [Acidimicrobiia bacterium]
MSTALVVAVAMALAFAVTNGLHDAANSIATLVMTRAAHPGPAVILAAVGNVIGPLLIGRAVADTIAGIVTVPSADVTVVLGAALTGAVAWNLITWWRGLPSSSGHALLGGLVGAALAEGGTSAVDWGGFDGLHP